MLCVLLIGLLLGSNFSGSEIGRFRGCFELPWSYRKLFYSSKRHGEFPSFRCKKEGGWNLVIPSPRFHLYWLIVIPVVNAK